jgi:hypothetical protein
VTAPDPIAARLIGSLFVDRGLVSESQIRVALEIQRETGEQLGQILVQRFGVSRRELARVVSEQWKDMGRGAPSAPEDAPSESWRPLGEIFVTRGFISEEELDGALKRQRKTGERLGEALVALGVISKFELAGALAEQMASLGEEDADERGHDQQANVVHLSERSSAMEEPSFGALTEVPPIPEGDPSGDGSESESTLVASEPTVVVPDAHSDALDSFDVLATNSTDADSEPWAAEGQEELVSVAAGAMPPFELDQPVDLWQKQPADGEPEPEAEQPAQAEPEPEAEQPVDLWQEQPAEGEPEPEAEQPTHAEPEPEAEQPVDVWWERPANAEAEPEAEQPAHAEPELEAEQPVDVWWEQPANAEAEPESEQPVDVWAGHPEPAHGEAEPEWEQPADIWPEQPREPEPELEFEPEAAIVDPEPHYDLEPEEVPESFGSWHLLVAEAEPRPGLSVAFAPTRAGYRLFAMSVVPSVGETIEVPDVGAFVVLRVGRSPLPLDTRVCVYVEESVAVLAGTVPST